MPQAPLMALLAPAPPAPPPSTRIERFPGLAAKGYEPHPLHGPDAVWVEKNCYGDLWIELLHCLRLDPCAMLPFTLAVDFEGDQWTFFKPPLGELHDLYGLDVQELAVWRPMVDHAREHLSAGKLIACEMDAFWLPDTAATDYRQKHTKTTIVLANIDIEEQWLGYFHNAGYYELQGEDFRGLFRIGEPEDPGYMPLFAELIRTDRVKRRAPMELASLSLDLLERHWRRRPRTNPLTRFGQRLTSEFPSLRSAGLAHYHSWAFATIRQAGAAFDLTAEYLRWQSDFGHYGLADAALRFDEIAQSMKTLILKAARSVNSGRPLQASELIETSAAAWEEGMAMVGRSLGCKAEAAWRLETAE
ncbi:DUF1839 family protein [Caenimonas aquaedulcis]|uniref:DUF1839 family protein n=1 Tax=Caenimonas aquaedulcis TaxID=2793270 RepID=A0A931MGL3_9BURK|nr:DUF1839 family protein [Caenimonas aquaedulcis]MBG9388306.1 DUF1839 family protein [Caenimonas aquaedulcis]